MTGQPGRFGKVGLARGWLALAVVSAAVWGAGAVINGPNEGYSYQGGPEDPVPEEGVTSDIPDEFAFAPTFSPDGTKIAFAVYAAQSTGLFLMNADGTGAKRLTPEGGQEQDPVFAPDVKRIVFTRGARIYARDVDGGGEVGLTPASDPSSSPGYSPDGRTIAYLRSVSSGSGQEVWLMNADGSDPRRLTETSGGEMGAPRFSPDGKRIAFVRSTNGVWEIWVVDADGSDANQLTNQDDSHPSFSPDGRHIVFAGNRDTVTGEIYVMDADGTHPKRLTNNSVEDTRPAYSPDGERIVFTSTRDGGENVYVMNADGTGAKRLTSYGVVEKPSP